MRKKLYTYTEVNDSTPIQKLSLKDQFRVILKKLTTTQEDELKNEDTVEEYKMELYANLLDFLNKALKPVREGKRSSVKLQISNKFNPVIEDVLNQDAIKKYYNYNLVRPNIQYDIHFFNTLYLEVKRD